MTEGFPEGVLECWAGDMTEGFPEGVLVNMFHAGYHSSSKNRIIIMSFSLSEWTFFHVNST